MDNQIPDNNYGMEPYKQDQYKSQLTQPIAAPASEATKIEQARVMAEVAMQAELAKRYPRNMAQVFQRIEETFTLSPSLIEQSKFSVPRKGSRPVIGFSIHFARAIAECVGNIVYSFKELSRENKQSEMFVYAWDLETNTMQSRSFIVPHTRDQKGGTTSPLTHARDIYENNANNAGKRVRDCILGVLPAAARIKGEVIVEALLRKSYPIEKIQKKVTDKIKEFKEIGVSRQALIKERDNRPPEMWLRSDLIALNEHYESIQSGIETIYDIFDIKQKSIDINIASPKVQNKTETKDRFKKPFEDKQDAAETKKATPAEQTSEKPFLHPVVEKIKKMFEDDTYFTTFDLMEEENSFSKTRVKAIILDNDKDAADILIQEIQAVLAR